MNRIKQRITESPVFNMISGRLKNQKIIKRLEHEFADLLETYQTYEESHQKSSEYIIWVCWWQGENAMTPIVKECYRRIRDFNQDKTVILITEEKLSQYVSFPDYIIKKYQEGKITRTHFSDLLRTELLYNYGGTWMDITIYTFSAIPARCFELPVYTGKNRPEKYSHNVSRNRWTSFYWTTSEKHNILFSFLHDFWRAYWLKYDELIEYFLIDYAIALAYKNIPAVRKELDTVDMNGCGPDFWQLLHMWREDYDEELLNQIQAEGWFQKLSYKGEDHNMIKARNPYQSFYYKLFLEKESENTP